GLLLLSPFGVPEERRLERSPSGARRAERGVVEADALPETGRVLIAFRDRHGTKNFLFVLAIYGHIQKPFALPFDAAEVFIDPDNRTSDPWSFPPADGIPPAYRPSPGHLSRCYGCIHVCRNCEAVRACCSPGSNSTAAQTSMPIIDNED